MSDMDDHPVVIHRHDSSARIAARKIGIDIPFPKSDLAKDEIVTDAQEETDID